MTLKVGDTAPEFTLLSDQWKTVKLATTAARKMLLASTSWPSRRLNQAASGGPGWNRLQKDDTRIRKFSELVDSPAANAAFAKQIGLTSRSSVT